MRIPSRWHICPNCVVAPLLQLLFRTRSRTYTFSNPYKALPVCRIFDPGPQHPAAAQIVLPPSVPVYSAGVVHHVHQAATRPSLLNQSKNPIHLQLAHMFFPLAACGACAAGSTPNPSTTSSAAGSHSLPHHRRRHAPPLIVGPNRSPPPPNTLAHQPHHSLAKFLRLPPVRLPALPCFSPCVPR